jgi:hypothetical protein
MNKLKIQGLDTHSAEDIAKKQAIRRELTLAFKNDKKEANKLAQ